MRSSLGLLCELVASLLCELFASLLCELVAEQLLHELIPLLSCSAVRLSSRAVTHAVLGAIGARRLPLARPSSARAFRAHVSIGSPAASRWGRGPSGVHVDCSLVAALLIELVAAHLTKLVTLLPYELAGRRAAMLSSSLRSPRCSLELVDEVASLLRELVAEIALSSCSTRSSPRCFDVFSSLVAALLGELACRRAALLTRR